jgi:hypothetical protein
VIVTMPADIDVSSIPGLASRLLAVGRPCLA